MKRLVAVAVLVVVFTCGYAFGVRHRPLPLCSVKMEPGCWGTVKAVYVSPDPIEVKALMKLKDGATVELDRLEQVLVGVR